MTLEQPSLWDDEPTQPDPGAPPPAVIAHLPLPTAGATPTDHVDPQNGASAPAAPPSDLPPLAGIIVRVHGAEVLQVGPDTADKDIISDIARAYPEVRGYTLLPAAERPRIARDGASYACADFRKHTPVNG